jgi:hypothetical protein
MGGKGSGGARPGAGRRRKSQSDGALTGSRRTRSRAATNQTPNQKASVPAAPGAPPPAASVVPLEIPQPPGSLTLDELAEWNDLAPRAATEGTLIDSTRYALRDLCQLRVLRDRLLRRVGDDGDIVIGAQGQQAAHPLLTRITTLSQRVEAGMVRFKLSPQGKELETAKPQPADPFAEFDAVPATTATGDTVN